MNRLDIRALRRQFARDDAELLIELAARGYHPEQVLSWASRALHLEANDGCGQYRSLNGAQLDVRSAREWAEDFFSQPGSKLDWERELSPVFDENYRRAQAMYASARAIPRVQMPVIEPRDMDEFEKNLKAGNIDIFSPLALDHPAFPESFPDPEVGTGKDWIMLGQKDGDPNDDKVPARIDRTACGRVNPTQNQVWFDKVCCYLRTYGLAKQGSTVTETTIIVSADSYIIDGHHRHFQAAICDPGLQLKSLNVPLNLDLLLKVGKSYGVAIGNAPNL